MSPALQQAEPKLILPGDPQFKRPAALTYSYGASQQMLADPRAAAVIEQWYQLEQDGWVDKGQYNVKLLLSYYTLKRKDPEAQRLVACLSFLDDLKKALPNGLEDPNDERVFHFLLKLILRPSKDAVLKAKYDDVLEFSSRLNIPVVVEKYARSYGEFSNTRAGASIYQGRDSVGVTAHELFIDPIANILVKNNEDAKRAGKAIVTNAELPDEQWNNLRIPCADESGNMRSFLLARCVRSSGANHDWMFKRPAP